MLDFDLQLMKASKNNSMFEVNELYRGLDGWIPQLDAVSLLVEKCPHSIA